MSLALLDIRTERRQHGRDDGEYPEKGFGELGNFAIGYRNSQRHKASVNNRPKNSLCVLAHSVLLVPILSLEASEDNQHADRPKHHRAADGVGQVAVHRIKPACLVTSIIA